MEDIIVKPIAYIKTDFKEKFGIPRQSGRVSELEGEIIFLPEYRTPEALRGIEGFSHLWLIFDFSESHTGHWSPTVRPPRLGGNERVGVFASRSPFRPNPIGLSVVKLERIEHTEKYGDTIVVSGVDLLDGTPILDIKPYLLTDIMNGVRGGYAEEVSMHKLDVVFPGDLIKKIPENKRLALINCIAEDPRPAYQNDDERVYGMSFAGFEIKFKVSGNKAIVHDVYKSADII